MPQNIIDVEFKLFGSFTLKQFGKMLIGCLVGVVIYALPLLPIYIKVPLILASVAVGFLTAIVPNFSIWLNGFLKALLISPRYVWIKENTPPELLVTKKDEEEKEKNLSVSASTNESKIDITDLPLDKIFVSSNKGSLAKGSEVDDPLLSGQMQNENLQKVYDQLFANDPRVQHSAMINPQQSRQQQPAQQQRSTFVQAGVGMNNIQSDPVQRYYDEIANLKTDLGKLTRDASYASKEQEILGKIDRIYEQIHSAQQPSGSGAVQSKIIGKNVRIENAPDIGKVVFGIVVDKTDRPIPDVILDFVDLNDENKEYRSISAADGRFASSTKLPYGTYVVKLEGRDHSFHTYKIEVNDQALPAFKFRER